MDAADGDEQEELLDALASAGPDWASIAESLNEGILAADSSNRIVYANRAAGAILGWEAQQLIGEPVSSLIPQRLRSRHDSGFAAFVRSGEGTIVGRPTRLPALRRDGTETPVELLIDAAEIAGQTVVVGLLRDVTDQIEIEGPGDLSDRLITSLAEATTLDTAWRMVLQALVDTLGWDIAILWLHDGTSDTLVHTANWPLAVDGFDAFIHASRRAFTKGEDLPGSVWESMAPAWITAINIQPDFVRSESAGTAGLRSAFAFPLTAGPRLHGVIEIFSTARRNRNHDLAQRLVTVGRELGSYLERRGFEEQRLAMVEAAQQARAEAERAGEQAARLAATLQRSLLPPSLPTIPGMQIAAAYRPALDGLDVGGDFYDVFRLSRDTWGAVIGDVCGKGAEAATVTALARYTIRAAAMQVRSPARALEMTNEAMLVSAAEGIPDRFATATLVRLRARPDGADAVIACAGHPPPLVRRADGTIEPAGRPGTLLGVVEHVTTSDSHVDLSPGDALVLVTDGILEARHRDVEWGEEGLAHLLSALTDPTPQNICDHIVTAAIARQGGTAADDIAVLVLSPSGLGTASPLA